MAAVHKPFQASQALSYYTLRQSFALHSHLTYRYQAYNTTSQPRHHHVDAIALIFPQLIHHHIWRASPVHTTVARIYVGAQEALPRLVEGAFARSR